MESSNPVLKRGYQIATTPGELENLYGSPSASSARTGRRAASTWTATTPICPSPSSASRRPPSPWRRTGLWSSCSRTWERGRRAPGTRCPRRGAPSPKPRGRASSVRAARTPTLRRGPRGSARYRTRRSPTRRRGAVRMYWRSICRRRWSRSPASVCRQTSIRNGSISVPATCLIRRSASSISSSRWTR